MEINLKDYYYELPEEKIAKYPMEPRDNSKLLSFQAGAITHQHFYDLPNLLPKNSFLFFNNTKVIPARLYFQKPSGAFIEIFLLEPVGANNIIGVAMQSDSGITWKCLIGNKKRWKKEETLSNKIFLLGKEITLTAEYEDFENNLVIFKWNMVNMRWAEIIQHFGELPLPPYFNRKPTKEDDKQYQTVYASVEGAVAAPTAGLHFSEKVLSEIEAKGIKYDYITLHVSAGTFQPIKVENAVDHTMHSEQVVYQLNNIKNILANLGNIIAIGTTSLRALESLYWFGLKLFLENDCVFFVKKLYPYENDKIGLPSVEMILENLISYMENNNIEEITGGTEIFIFPGYEFKICKGLITNYHLPSTTLILLVAAFVGNDWKKIYETALNNNYRFLSYGDSSLLLP